MHSLFSLRTFVITVLANRKCPQFLVNVKLTNGFILYFLLESFFITVLRLCIILRTCTMLRSGVLTIYMENQEIPVGKSNGTHHSIWSTSEIIGFFEQNKKGRRLYILKICFDGFSSALTNRSLNMVSSY